MQSPEFPAYRWMPPASYTRGRVPGQPSVIVIHTTEGSEGPRSAEDGAAYDQRRPDGTSAHFYVDSDSVVQCVRTTDEAHTAAGRGNDIGIHIEVCGRAGQTAAQWDDPVSRATIDHLAGLCRTLLHKYPRIRAVDLTPAQLRAGQRWAFCEHKDISVAWGETDHWDPGPAFPWARLFQLITTGGDEDMAFDDKALAKLNALYALAFSGGPSCGAEVDPGNNDRGKSNSIVNKLDALLETASHPPVAVQVDAAQVAAALAANTGFLAAVAQAVNDDQSRRLAQ